MPLVRVQVNGTSVLTTLPFPSNLAVLSLGTRVGYYVTVDGLFEEGCDSMALELLELL